MLIEKILVKNIRYLDKVIENNIWHNNISVFKHTLNVVKNLKILLRNTDYPRSLNTTIGRYKKSELLIMCAYLHDTGKIETLVTLDGVTSCPGHELVSAEKTLKILSALSFKKSEIKYIFEIIKNHGKLNGILNNKHPEILDTSLKNYKNEFSQILGDLVIFAMADTMGSELNETSPEDYDCRIRVFKKMLSEDYKLQ